MALNNLKTKTVMNAKVSMLIIRVEAIRYLLLHNLLSCTFKKNMDRVSKVLKSSKHRNIWFQMKEHLNIQHLFTQYLFNILAIRYFKIKDASFLFIFFFFCAECDT